MSARSKNPRIGGRCRSRQLNGRHFDDATRLAVWNKAKSVKGHDPAQVRKDAFGAKLIWDRYGCMDDEEGGWEIDHIQPVAEGGTDDLANLQALFWKNNRRKADLWPDWRDMPIWHSTNW